MDVFDERRGAPAALQTPRRRNTLRPWPHGGSGRSRRPHSAARSDGRTPDSSLEPVAHHESCARSISACPRPILIPMMAPFFTAGELPARFRAWRIADPSIVSMAPRYLIAFRCRKAKPSRRERVAGASRESVDCRRDALGPQRQPNLVAEQLVLGAAARVRLAVFENLPHAFAA